jgi:hypothetical protein
VPCCQFADEESLEHDAEVYNCDTCPVLEERSKLSAGNLRALQTYQLLARRVVVDFRLEGLVFDGLRLRLTADETRRLVEQLDLIHAERCPTPIQTHG